MNDCSSQSWVQRNKHSGGHASVCIHEVSDLQLRLTMACIGLITMRPGSVHLGQGSSDWSGETWSLTRAQLSQTAPCPGSLVDAIATYVDAEASGSSTRYIVHVDPDVSV